MSSTKEPEYVYKKGQGWVIQLGPREFTVGWIRPDDARSIKGANAWLRNNESEIQAFDHFVEFVANLPHKLSSWDIDKLREIWAQGHAGDTRYFERLYYAAQETFNSYCYGPCCVEDRLMRMLSFWKSRL